MKRILYSFISLLMVTGCLVSCSDDDDNSQTFSTPAEQAAQGTYVGNYVRVQQGTTDAGIEATGTFILKATDTPNLAEICFVSDDLEELVPDNYIALNIAHADLGFMFYTTYSSNPVAGRIDENGNVKVAFSKSVISGRSTRTYNYEFIGKRQ